MYQYCFPKKYRPHQELVTWSFLDHVCTLFMRGKQLEIVVACNNRQSKYVHIVQYSADHLLVLRHSQCPLLSTSILRRKVTSSGSLDILPLAYTQCCAALHSLLHTWVTMQCRHSWCRSLTHSISIHKCHHQKVLHCWVPLWTVACHAVPNHIVQKHAIIKACRVMGHHRK